LDLNMPTVRILSYNIHKGLTPANRRFVLERMRTAIRSVDAEVVFLQEVQGEHRHHAARFVDWPVAGQCEYLADSIWPHHAYGRNALYDHGHHGNAILSKHPFASWENLDVSNNRFERRGLLHGVIRHPALAKDLHLICCHLDLFERAAGASRWPSWWSASPPRCPPTPRCWWPATSTTGAPASVHC
jgi:endonuclease/exonuclease/phosphatase family metal-dependent hydrolase